LLLLVLLLRAGEFGFWDGIPLRKHNCFSGVEGWACFGGGEAYVSASV
jgi:hypothetical protein